MGFMGLKLRCGQSRFLLEAPKEQSVSLPFQSLAASHIPRCGAPFPSFKLTQAHL